MADLEDIRPRRRNQVFDLAEEAGFDVSDWIESSNDPRGPKANPKYCYEWSFVEPRRLIVLNLWHSGMTEEDGRILTRDNFRADAEYHRTVSQKPSWAKRAQRLDDALQTALKENLSVRVIIIDGIRRRKDDPAQRPSKVLARDLDPEPWTITSYDWQTGAYELTRGIFHQFCIDQFDLDLAKKAAPEKVEVTTSTFVRDPLVRRRVLQRSQGRCELCGKDGFVMASGARYLETHHVIPLSEGGPDEDNNVVALCADDHRKAHYSADREHIARQLTVVASARVSQMPNEKDK